jgi:hypothetical protein
MIDGDSDAELRLHIFVKLKQNRRKLSLAICCVHLAVSCTVIYKGDPVALTVAADRLDRPNNVGMDACKRCRRAV